MGIGVKTATLKKVGEQEKSGYPSGANTNYSQRKL